MIGTSIAVGDNVGDIEYQPIKRGSRFLATPCFYLVAAPRFEPVLRVMSREKPYVTYRF
jgi:hypothetical protein